MTDNDIDRAYAEWADAITPKSEPSRLVVISTHAGSITRLLDLSDATFHYIRESVHDCSTSMLDGDELRIAQKLISVCRMRDDVDYPIPSIHGVIILTVDK